MRQGSLAPSLLSLALAIAGQQTLEARDTLRPIAVTPDHERIAHGVERSTFMVLAGRRHPFVRRS